MTTHPREWTLALLLLLAAAMPHAATADSPTWADEQLLLKWPEALSNDRSPDPFDLAEFSSGRATISDGDGETTGGTIFASLPQENELFDDAAVQPTGLHRLVEPPVGPPLSALPPSGPVGWYILPAGVMYKSYIAGEKEPRMAARYLNEKDRGPVFEATIGGRLCFVRHGTPGPINPQGFEWDLEAAAMLRQDIQQNLDVEAVDFRIGSILVWRRGPTAVKAGYYHLSSHLGDEYLLRNPNYPRLNYVRDSLLVGVHHNLRPDFALYGEVAYAVRTDGGAKPLELQFGAEYTPIDADVTRSNAPVAAVNGHLRQDFGFGGSVNMIVGWEWRGRYSNSRLRIGGQYYNGKEIQWSFYNNSVAFTGIGIWYDF